RDSYCLHQNKEGSETETIQLIVGRSTIQIWHQIQSDDKIGNSVLPNNGEPFLEYIWTNRIPIEQEGEKTRLRIEYFEHGLNDGLHDKLPDFSLKVYWHVWVDGSNKKNVIEEDEEISEV